MTDRNGLVGSLCCIILINLTFAASPVFSSREGRIVGGEDAQPNQFPYMASLRRRSSNNHFCAGSIVNNFWVLTAAHCTIDETILSIEVAVGSLQIKGGTNHRLQAIRYE